MNQEMEISAKHGKILIIIGVAMVPVFLFLSDGYDPRLGPLTSFYYSMTIFDAQWFCHEVPRKGFDLHTDIKCWNIVIHTKYLAILCVIIITYGVLITKKLIMDPFLYFKKKYKELKRRKNINTSKDG